MAHEIPGTRPAWAEVPMPVPPTLDADQVADVCIIGAGICGMSIADELTRRGLSVVVLDDGPIGGGETARTTAHITCAIDSRLYRLEHMHGAEAAIKAAQSHAEAIERIDRIVHDEKIDCGFERLDGFLAVPTSRSDEAERLISAEYDVARRAGLGVEIIPAPPVTTGFAGPCLRFERQAQFHPMKYLAGLTDRIFGRRGRIFTAAHAHEIRGGKDAHVITASGRRISAGAIVVATNTPVNDTVAIHTKQAPYRTYVVSFRWTLPRQPCLLWDGPWGNEAYHYVRLAHVGPGPRDVELIVGGEDHKTGQADDADARWARLEAWTRERFPDAGEVRHRWSGQVMEPHDELAFIGRNPLDADNVYVATGHSGNGMTYAAIAAMLIPELIVGRDHPWASLYSPSRLTLRSTPTMAKETVNFIAQYKDWVTPGEVDSVDKIAPGAGAIIRRGTHRIAAYRDESGRVHERSAVCPHLGCVVHFNPGEKSWDCPCHGSRFDAKGKVLNGPANTDLADPPGRDHKAGEPGGNGRGGLPVEVRTDPLPAHPAPSAFAPGLGRTADDR